MDQIIRRIVLFQYLIKKKKVKVSRETQVIFNERRNKKKKNKKGKNGKQGKFLQVKQKEKSIKRKTIYLYAYLITRNQIASRFARTHKIQTD